MNTELVHFHGQQIVTLRQADGEVYVAIKPIVANLGLGWHGQFERLQRDLVLSSTVRVIRTVAEDGKTREMLCLPLDMLTDADLAQYLGITLEEAHAQIEALAREHGPDSGISQVSATDINPLH